MATDTQLVAGYLDGDFDLDELHQALHEQEQPGGVGLEALRLIGEATSAEWDDDPELERALRRLVEPSSSSPSGLSVREASVTTRGLSAHSGLRFPPSSEVASTRRASGL